MTKHFTLLFIKIFSALSFYMFASECYSEEKAPSYRNFYQELIKKKFVLIPHKGTYLLPVSYNAEPNNEVYEKALPEEIQEDHGDFNANIEAEFQISFLILTNKNIFNSQFETFIGYTHQSWWQLYNSDWSRQFRETNHTPEIFFRKVLKKSFSLFSGEFLAYDFGYIHQSNGQIQELSRSWDRLFYRFAILYDNLLLKTTLWYRVPENEGSEENPRIYNYLGYGEFEINHKFHTSNFQLRVIPGVRKQGFELSYSTPMKEGVRFFTKIGYGYGLSLLDYNHKSRKLGIGFVITDPFTRQ